MELMHYRGDYWGGCVVREEVAWLLSQFSRTAAGWAVRHFDCA